MKDRVYTAAMQTSTSELASQVSKCPSAMHHLEVSRNSLFQPFIWLAPLLPFLALELQFLFLFSFSLSLHLLPLSLFPLPASVSPPPFFFILVLHSPNPLRLPTVKGLSLCVIPTSLKALVAVYYLETESRPIFQFSV